MEDTSMNQQPMLPSSGKATASLVCGIISLGLAWFGYSAIAGFILAIIALVFGNKERKLPIANAGAAKAGFIMGIIGIVINSICFVACVLCVAALGVAGAYC